jgi:hypothetical protein
MAENDGEHGSMTIIYDPALRHSTHLESGLAVQWVRDEPPMERSTRFKLIANGSEVEFDGTNDYGEHKIRKLYPDADFTEVHRRATDLREINYSAVVLRVGWPVREREWSSFCR